MIAVSPAALDRTHAHRGSYVIWRRRGCLLAWRSYEVCGQCGKKWPLSGRTAGWWHRPAGLVLGLTGLIVGGVFLGVSWALGVAVATVIIFGLTGIR